jgi:CRP-like cAMP-binding protein
MTDFYQAFKHRFPYLSDDKLAGLFGLGSLVRLGEGEAFVRTGEQSYRVGLVLAGLMRNYIVNEQGEEVTVLFAGEMQVIAPYSTILLQKPATETAAAIEPTVLLVIDFRTIKAQSLTDPVYMRLYTELIETALVAAIERIDDFVQKNPEQRYRWLLDTQGHLISRVPLKYVASYLGITAVSLSRIRKRLATHRN